MNYAFSCLFKYRLVHNNSHVFNSFSILQKSLEVKGLGLNFKELNCEVKVLI